MLEFEDELFDDYGNTSKYHMMKKPQEYKNTSFIDPSEKEFFKKSNKRTCIYFERRVVRGIRAFT
jgi:hypothetical protein